MQFFLQYQGHLILRTLFLLDVPDGKQQCHRVIFVFLGLPSFSPRGFGSRSLIPVPGGPQGLVTGIIWI